MADFFTRGPSNVGDIITSTFEEMHDTIVEQFMNNNRVLRKFKKTADMKDGGREIVVPIETAENGTVAAIGRTSTLLTTIGAIYTQAGFRWAHIGGTYGIDFIEEGMNMGKAQFKDLLKGRLKNLMGTFENKMETQLLAASTPDANNAWSLYDVIDSSNPTLGNYGDIDRTSAYWQSYEAASGSFALQGLEDLRTASETVALRSNGDKPDLHITTLTNLNKYKARLTPFERLTSREKGDLEFKVLTFEDGEVVASSQAQSNTWLGVNTKHVRVAINKHINFKIYPFVSQAGGITKIAPVLTEWQVVSDAPRLSFKLTSLT